MTSLHSLGLEIGELSMGSKTSPPLQPWEEEVSGKGERRRGEDRREKRKEKKRKEKKKKEKRKKKKEKRKKEKKKNLTNSRLNTRSEPTLGLSRLNFQTLRTRLSESHTTSLNAVSLFTFGL